MSDVLVDEDSGGKVLRLDVGPTRPERNGPLGADDVTVSRAAVCQCHHLRQCRLDRMCLLDIGVGEVLDAVEHRLAASEQRRG